VFARFTAHLLKFSREFRILFFPPRRYPLRDSGCPSGAFNVSGNPKGGQETIFVETVVRHRFFFLLLQKKQKTLDPPPDVPCTRVAWFFAVFRGISAPAAHPLYVVDGAWVRPPCVLPLDSAQ
jgi:hypothetical protein